MKKINLIILVIFLTLLSIIPVNATTNTKERTEDNYLVPDSIAVTDSNKEAVLKTPAVDASEKVYDFAELFTDDEEEKLKEKIDDYINTYDLDLAVVTISTNNKSSSRDYADDFYDYNNFGISSTKDGVLFLIDMDKRQIWMSTTGNAIKMYNDYRIDEALDAVYSYMSDEDYYEGVIKYIEIISDYAAKGLPNGNDNKLTVGKSILFSLIGGLILSAIIMGILISKNKLARKATTASEYLNKDSVDVKVLGEVLISSNTVKHKIERDSGSSTHSGSSGTSHGGGGHGF